MEKKIDTSCEVTLLRYYYKLKENSPKCHNDRIPTQFTHAPRTFYKCAKMLTPPLPSDLCPVCAVHIFIIFFLVGGITQVLMVIVKETAFLVLKGLLDFQSPDSFYKCQFSICHCQGGMEAPSDP